MTKPGLIRRACLPVAAMAVTTVVVGCASSGPKSEPRTASPAQEVVSREEFIKDAEKRLEDARKRLSAEIDKQEGLSVSFEGPPIDLAAPVTLDFEYGSGHGGTLVLVRLTVGAETTKCERIAWDSYRKDPAEPAGAASRAEIPTSTVAPLLDSLRALSQAKVTAHHGERMVMSSTDFFVLARVCRDGRATDLVWEFAGYKGDLHSDKYVGPEFVVHQAREIIEPLLWQPVATEDYRTTHFRDAFARNREFLVESFHWWVMERSLEALGWFGDRSSIPTVEWIRDHGTKIVDRQYAKITHVLNEADVYLEGPPREVPEK